MDRAAEFALRERLFNQVPPEERCSVCGQPDNCGDCTHEQLTISEVLQLLDPRRG